MKRQLARVKKQDLIRFDNEWQKSGYLKVFNTEDGSEVAVQRTFLIWAAKEGNANIIKELCEVGGKDYLLMVDKQGQSALHFAVKYRHEEAALVLSAMGGYVRMCVRVLKMNASSSSAHTVIYINS